jgi:hypothetical protein
MNDTAGAAAEVAKQVGTSADFANMNSYPTGSYG